MSNINRKLMTRWILTAMFLLMSILTFNIVLNDRGTGISYIYDIPIIIIESVIGLLMLIFWIKEYIKKRKKYHIIFILIPLIISCVHVMMYQFTQKKINKEYFILAKNQTDNEHQFEYYFRIDSTLKIKGIYFWDVLYDYQKFSMRGDTIFFETIIEKTGIQSKYYLKKINDKIDNRIKGYLIPLDKNYKPIDSLSKFEIIEDKIKTGTN